MYGYDFSWSASGSYASPRTRRRRHVSPPTPPVFPVSPTVPRSRPEPLEIPEVQESPEVRDLRRLIDSRVSLAMSAEAGGNPTSAAHHLDRAAFLEEELGHEQRVAAAR